MPPIKLSAVIITFNEEKNIERCLRSLIGVADEVLVVDSFSNDDTEKICRSFDVRFIQHKFEGHIEQKNYAMGMASHDHILSLDADEALSDTLRDAIINIKNKWRCDAYQISRLNNYCGKFIHHGGWYPDSRIRLWDRRKGSWGGENPHDQVIMNEPAIQGKIKGDLFHFTYRNLSEHMLQMDKFSEIAARESFRKGRKVYFVIHLMLNPLFIFIKSYFLRLGFLDGKEGFLLAVTGSYYRFLKYAKLRALYASKA